MIWTCGISCTQFWTGSDNVWKKTYMFNKFENVFYNCPYVHVCMGRNPCLSHFRFHYLKLKQKIKRKKFLNCGTVNRYYSEAIIDYMLINLLGTSLTCYSEIMKLNKKKNKKWISSTVQLVRVLLNEFKLYSILYSIACPIYVLFIY